MHTNCCCLLESEIVNKLFNRRCQKKYTELENMQNLKLIRKKLFTIEIEKLFHQKSPLH